LSSLNAKKKTSASLGLFVVVREQLLYTDLEAARQPKEQITPGETHSLLDLGDVGAVHV